MYDSEYDPQLHQMSEQQQELLIQGKLAPPPTSVAHIADHVEASGAKIEETLQRLNCSHNTLFFVSGWMIILVAIYSIFASLFSFSILGLFQSLFLAIFGFVMMVLDIPGAPRWAARYRVVVFRQIKFLTRVTGKALWTCYLGCMVLVCLWPSPKHKNGFLILCSVLLSAFVLSVGIVGLFIGIRKSLQLEKVRKQILARYRGNTAEVYRLYAITDPTHGIQFDEFERLCLDFTGGRYKWNISDLSIIYNALDEHQKGGINEKEFNEWVAGPITYL